MTTAQGTSGQAPPQENPPCKFSSDQYHWLIEAGFLTTDHRVELIEGEILTMPPMGDEHGDSIRNLNRWLAQHAGNTYIHQCQVTTRLNDNFTPDPDFVLFRYEDHEYRGGNRPQPADILLVIEVADSSLQRDLGPKSLGYARAGVPELWVLDLPHRQVNRLIQPTPDGYQEQTTSGEDETITPMLIPSLQMPVGEAL